MECPSCQFQNMPGSNRCARCSASLTLATATIEVHPPRAGRLLLFELAFWKCWHALGRTGTKLAPTLGTALGTFASRAEVTHFDLPTILRCVIPGWPQYRRGDRPRAFVFLLSYLVFLLPGVVLTGTGLGSLLLGLAAAVHIVSVVDAVVTTFATGTDRFAFTLATGLVLCFILYVPTGWLISRVATPISIAATIPPFQQGDVLWYSRWAEPQPGDLVLYALPRINVPGRMAAGNAANYVFQGEWIGRVIAMPGQTVSVQQGCWLVDGVRSELQPISAPSMSDGTSWTVPHGNFFVLSDGLVPPGARIDANTLTRLYITPRPQVVGRLYFRSLPLSRMSMLH